MTDNAKRKERSDKGQKRGTYNLKVRKQRKEFNDMRRSLDAVEAFERKELQHERAERMRQQRRKRYYEAQRAAGIRKLMSAESKKNQKIKRREERERLLADLVPARICPLCDEIRLPSRAWVYIKKTNQVFCRICYKKLIDVAGKELFELFVDYLAANGLQLSSNPELFENFARNATNGIKPG